MLTNLTASIMIVFAGGPHTPTRTALACHLLTNQPPPAIIYLTGIEFQTDYSNLTEHIRSIAATLPTKPPVITDTCTTTWESCGRIAPSARLLVNSDSLLGNSTKNNEPITNNPAVPGSPNNRGEAATAHVLIITSNYHAPRVRWLLGGLLRSPVVGCWVDKLLSEHLKASLFPSTATQQPNPSATLRADNSTTDRASGSISYHLLTTPDIP
jgi:hypothetical protein